MDNPAIPYEQRFTAAFSDFRYGDDYLTSLAELARIPDWHTDAACAKYGVGLADQWFPEKGGSTKLAKEICATCPVRQQCETYGLQNGERYGVWGGHSERERRKLIRQRVRDHLADNPKPRKRRSECARGHNLNIDANVYVDTKGRTRCKVCMHLPADQKRLIDAQRGKAA